MSRTSAEPTEPHPAPDGPSAEGRGADDTASGFARVHARRGILVRLAYRLLWNVDDAEDAVQNALLQAAKKQDQLADRGKLWSWVRAIVVRQCYDTQRARQRRQRATDVVRERAELQADDFAGQAAMGAELREHIQALPERQRTAIVLRHLEELSYTEIATIMGTSESTARVQVRNAREALRRAYTRKA